MHAAVVGHRAREHPLRQRRVRERLARIDVFLHPLGHLLPAGLLPVFERAAVPAEAPADRQVDFRGRIGDLLQVYGDVVKHVAEHRPQELRLRIGRFAQQLQALGRRLLQDTHDDLVGLLAARAVLAALRVQHLDVLAFLLVEAGAGLLAQGARLHQLGQHGRRGIDRGERIVLQRVLHRPDDVRHGVQAHHIGRAERGRLGAAQLRARQVIHHVERDTVLGRLREHRQDRKDADPVGDEVRGVLGAHHALAKRGGQEGFQLVEDVAARVGGRDQLDQVHVARRIEEVHAAEARLQLGVEAVRQRADRQARGVGGEDRMRRDVRRDLLVQVVLPVHALGDGLDDEVAVAQALDVVLVVGDLDQGRVVLDAQRRRRQLLQILNGLEHDAVLQAILGREIEQRDGNLGVDQVRGDLRAHHAGAQHGHAPDEEVGARAGLRLRLGGREFGAGHGVLAGREAETGGATRLHVAPSWGAAVRTARLRGPSAA